MSRRLFVAAIGALWLSAGPALGHADIRPATVEAATLTTFTLSVPNERTAADTVQVAIRLPAGFTDVVGIAGGGWTVSSTSDGVVRWAGGRIRGDASASFTFRARVPATPGVTVTIPAIQTYSNGEVDRWIERADPELPAPEVQIAATAGTARANEPSTGGGSALWLAIGTGAAAVAVGALAWGRRRRPPDAAR